MTHRLIKHVVTCPPGCDHDTCDCPCIDHTDACWPGRPDPACCCQQDHLFEEDTNEDLHHQRM